MAEKRGDGRPVIEITDELIQKMANAMLVGAYVETAAMSLGISKQTLYTWFKEANKLIKAAEKAGEPRPNDDMKVKFLDAVHRAMAQSEMRDLLVIDQSANENKDWKASAWRLERKYPKRWGRREQVEVSEGEGFQEENAENIYQKLLEIVTEEGNDA